MSPLLGNGPWDELPPDLRPTPWHLLLTPETIEGDHEDILSRGRSRWVGETLGLPNPLSCEPEDLLWLRWFRRTMDPQSWDREYEQDWQAAIRNVVRKKMAEEPGDGA